MKRIDWKKLIAHSSFLCSFVNSIRVKKGKIPVLPVFTQRSIRRFMDLLNQQYPEVSVSCLDIGARDGLEVCGIFSPLAWLKNKTLHGIEPDQEQAKQLSASGAYDRIFTDAIGKPGEAILSITQQPGRSSIYEPDLDMVSMIGWNPKEFVCTQKIPVHLKGLNEIVGEMATYDFLKMDIQGCEYNALTSIPESMQNSLLCVHLETQRLPYMKGQTDAMGSILQWMVQHHFFLLSIDPLYAPFLTAEDNLIFVKDPRQIHDCNTLLKACLAGFLSQAPQYVWALLQSYTKRYPKEDIVQKLAKMMGVSLLLN